MKTSKKVLSVILSIAMIMTTISVCFVSFGAGSLTGTALNNLVDALKNDTVANANYAVSGVNMNVTDPDGSIINAAKAYYAAFTTVRGTSNPTNTNTTYRTSTMINTIIKTAVEGAMGAEDYAAYNCATVLGAFNANYNVNATTNGSNSTVPSSAAVTITVNVTLSESILISYDSVSEIPDNLTSSYQMTFKNSRQNAGNTWSPKYYIRCDAPSQKSGAAIDVSSLKNFKEKDEYYSDMYSLSTDELLAMEDEIITECYNDITEAYNAIPSSLKTTFNYYFDAAAIETFIINLEYVYNIKKYIPVVNAIEEAMTVDFSQMSLNDATGHYSNIKTRIDAFNALDADVKEALSTACTFDVAEAETYAASVFKYIETLQINNNIATIDAEIAKMAGYTKEAVASGDVTLGMIETSIAVVRAGISAFDTFTASTVAEILAPDYIENAEAAIAALDEVIDFEGYNATFVSKYKYFVESVQSAINVDENNLLDALKGIDEWYAELDDFEEELAENLSAEDAALIVKNLSEEMHTKVDAQYAALASIVTAQVTTAKNILDSIVAFYGETVVFASLETAKMLKEAFANVNVDAYDYLIETENYDLAESVIADYEAISAYIEDYNNFFKTGGFDKYNTTEIGEVVRPVTDTEVIRDEDFVADDEKIEGVIEKLDKILGSDEFASLTGLNLEETLGPDLLSALYSNDIINIIVSFLYPTVANVFADVWAGLPDTYTVEDGSTLNSMLKSDPVKFTLNIDELEKASVNLGMAIFPTSLAKTINDRYPDEFSAVTEILAKATTKSKDGDPWQDAAILNEEGVLDLDWGVTDRASFIKAADAALAGLEPLLLALLCNTQFGPDLDDEDNAYKVSVGTGSGKATATLLSATVTITIEEIQLNLIATANEGYNNLIVPILEALGSDLIPNGNSFKTTAEVVEKGLLEPVEAFLAKVAAAPVSTIASILPNICYALSADRVLPLLSMLKTDISYSARAYASYKAAFGIISGHTTTEELMGDSLPIDIGTMLDIDSLGLDLSSLNAIISMIAGDSLVLPKIDSVTLATLGELTWKDTARSEKSYDYGPEGQAAFIEANKADVLLFVIDYVVEALSRDGFLDSVLALIAGTDEEGNPNDPADIPELVNEIINNVISNPNDAIAALVELFNVKEYNTKPGDFNWAQIDVAEETESTEETESVDNLYSELWTKEQAMFVAEHLPTFIDDVILMAGVKVGDEQVLGLKNLIETGLKSVLSDDNMNTIVEFLTGDETIKVLLGTLGIDVTPLEGKVYEFEEGKEREGFEAAITEILTVLKPVLEFILADENLVVRFTTEDGKVDTIELAGHNAYTDAVMILLEALGAEGIASTATLKNDIVGNIVKPLMSVIEKVEKDPYAAVETLIPNILYFIASDGVKSLADNILYPINQVLETIRPIYELNIFALVEDIDLQALINDPVETLAVMAAAEIEKSTGNKVALDFTAMDLFDQFSFGTIVKDVDADGRTMHRVENTTEDAADMITVVLRLILDQVLYSENATLVVDYLRNEYNLSDEQYAFLYSLVYALRLVPDDTTDATMNILAYIFYGIDTGANAIGAGYNFLSYDWAKLFNTIVDSDTAVSDKFEALFESAYETFFKTIYDEYSRDRIDDILDNIPGGEDVKEKTNILLDFIKGIIDRLKDLFETIKNAFGIK